MPNLGNAWHIPANPEPRGRGGMRDPVGAAVAGSTITVISGNQFQGAGNPGNQLQDGSAVVWRIGGPGAPWAESPMTFDREVANNKYFTAPIPLDGANPGDDAEYYLRIAYDDHDTTYLCSAGEVSEAVEDEAIAQDLPFRVTVDDPAVRGRWGDVVELPNVAVHAALLPDHRVLVIGRRDRPDQTLNEQSCTPFVWDPATGESTFTAQPLSIDGATVNLFCAGHAFLADGRLLVVGGHIEDSDGISQASAFDWRDDTWTALPPMTAPGGQEVRRWYPTCTTLPDGRVLVLSGSFIDRARPFGEQIQVVDLLHVWDEDRWDTIPNAAGAPLNYIGLPLYPRMHVTGDGRVLMSGSTPRTELLDTGAPGGFTLLGYRRGGNRDYCPAVMVDADRILYLGGGGGTGGPPSNEVEVVDLATPPPPWQPAAPMRFARRHHNAVVLPDGSVLVVGGTRGVGFNNLDPGQPVHVAERWDPATGAWEDMAAEQVDRCYHSSALLLADGRVLSAGGGEYHEDDGTPNDPADNHRNGQIYSPPYLFRGPRPEITAAPDAITYGTTFTVTTPQAADIGRVSLVHPGSVTHAFDAGQRIAFLDFTAGVDATGAATLTVTAPASPEACPPGHLLLFVLSADGVPSVARTVQVGTGAAPRRVAGGLPGARPPDRPSPTPATGAFLPMHDLEADVEALPKGTPVVVGITPSCPYGIGSCWGGAYAALGALTGVEIVRPVPNSGASTAEVFLRNAGLPALGLWARQFEAVVGGTYGLRGVEVTVEGSVIERDGALVLAAAPTRPSVRLGPITPADKVQWDLATHSPHPLEPDEADAYDRLASAGTTGAGPVVVTGPLVSTPDGYELRVRRFAAAD
ncbi:MAG: galactose oxidase-like domain-containing protein [Actinomycetota bacterium]|nr:galactose oxidase-like domain-containing protein [Actinomycetota bacterium]